MTVFIIWMALAYALAWLCLYQYLLYRNNKQKQNNDLALRHRNLALMFGILCIIITLSFILNRDEFPIFINSLNNSSMKEKSMQPHLSGTTRVNGLLEPQGAFYYYQSSTKYKLS